MQSVPYDVGTDLLKLYLFPTVFTFVSLNKRNYLS